MENKKDKWGRKRKFVPKIIECGYRKCTRGENGTKKKFLQKTYNHFFCDDDHRVSENSLLSGKIKKRREKKYTKKCSKCKTGKVPPNRRFLCDICYRNSESNYFEEEAPCYHQYQY